MLKHRQDSVFGNLTLWVWGQSLRYSLFASVESKQTAGEGLGDEIPFLGLQIRLDRRIEIIARRWSLQTSWLAEGRPFTGQGLSSYIQVQAHHLLGSRDQRLKEMSQDIRGGCFVYGSTYVVLVSKSFKIGHFNVK